MKKNHQTKEIHDLVQKKEVLDILNDSVWMCQLEVVSLAHGANKYGMINKTASPKNMIRMSRMGEERTFQDTAPETFYQRFLTKILTFKIIE